MTCWLLVAGDFVQTGGMDQANHALASYLLDRGHTVHLVAHRTDPILRARGARVHEVPKPAGSYSLGRPLLDAAGRWWAARLRSDGVRTVVNGGNCLTPAANWVHYVHAAYEANVSGGLARRLKHRVDARQALRRERRALRGAPVVIANSERTRRDVIERLGVARDRVRTVYYGVDPVRFRPLGREERASVRADLNWHASRPYIVFVGALGDRRKGFDTVLSAFMTLCAEPSWDPVLVVVGRGQELAAWQTRAFAAGIGDRVEFLGFRADVDRIVASANLLVAPTRYEAYGLGVHEALCCGVPALVSADAGVAERYPPELGELLLPDPANAEDLVARLRTWRSGPERLRAPLDTLAAGLRARTWSDMSSELVELVERVE